MKLWKFTLTELSKVHTELKVTLHVTLNYPRCNSTTVSHETYT